MSTPSEPCNVTLHYETRVFEAIRTCTRVQINAERVCIVVDVIRVNRPRETSESMKNNDGRSFRAVNCARYTSILFVITYKICY